MVKKFLLLFLFISASAFAQEAELPDFNAVDSLYREDQFYVGVTYNVLQQRPRLLKQNKFSLGLSLGFLRDMPINEKRTVSIAAGLGYSLNNFNQNMQIARLGDNDPQYAILGSDSPYEKSKITLHYVDLPIEFRWRTSTFDSHRFFRIYTGFKVSYLFYDRYKFESRDNVYRIRRNEDLNRVQYGVYTALGYNTWNVQVYYGLNPLFKSGELDGEPLDMHMLNIGLMFYIL